jgi:transposase-like protein
VIQFGQPVPQIGPLMDQAKSEVLAFITFPRAHWSKIWSTNPLERVNKEIRDRACVVGIFPNEAAVIWLVDAVLADMCDEWQSGERLYLSEGRWRYRRELPRRVGTEDLTSKPTTQRARYRASHR